MLGHVFTKLRVSDKTFDNMAGETAKKLVADIQAAGGIITLEDMANYQVGKVLKCFNTFIMTSVLCNHFSFLNNYHQVQWEEPTTHKLKNLGYTLISSPPPGSGAILSSILGVGPS